MRRRHLLNALFALPLCAALSAPGVGSATEKKKGGGVSYHQFPTLTAAIVRGDGRRGVLTVEAGLDIPDADLRTKVLVLEPRLLDAYNSALAVYGTNLRLGAAPNLDQLAARLQGETDRVVGRPGAKLLLGTVLLN